MNKGFGNQNLLSLNQSLKVVTATFPSNPPAVIIGTQPNHTQVSGIIPLSSLTSNPIKTNSAASILMINEKLQTQIPYVHRVILPQQLSILPTTNPNTNELGTKNVKTHSDALKSKQLLSVPPTAPSEIDSTESSQTQNNQPASLCNSLVTTTVSHTPFNDNNTSNHFTQYPIDIIDLTENNSREIQLNRCSDNKLNATVAADQNTCKRRIGVDSLHAISDTNVTSTTTVTDLQLTEPIKDQSVLQFNNWTKELGHRRYYMNDMNTAFTKYNEWVNIVVFFLSFFHLIHVGLLACFSV